MKAFLFLMIAVSALGQTVIQCDRSKPSPKCPQGQNCRCDYSKPAHFGGVDPINIDMRSDYTDDKGVHHDIACMEGWHMEWEPQKGTSGANTVWVAWCYKWPDEPHKPKPSVKGGK